MISLLPDALCFEIIHEGILSKNGLMTEEVNSSKSRTEHTLPSTVVDDHEKPSASSKVPSGINFETPVFILGGGGGDTPIYK